MVHALLLPSELKHHIAELSSRDSLASLAQTHTAYQKEAEQALYRTLSNPSLKCLETLATNSEKAGLVRFLAIEYVPHEYVPYENDEHWRAIDYLLNALVDMHSLSDLRLRMPRSCYEVQPWVKSLDKILCDDHFRLQTLCCDEALDLSGIITSQTELQILGIYNLKGCDDEVGFMESLKHWQLQNVHLHLPVIVVLQCDDYTLDPKYYCVCIFPTFYSIDRHSTIHRVLANSFAKDQSSYTLPVADAGEISQLSIFLVDPCDMPSVHALTKNLTITFPKITTLNFSFKNPCEIPSQETKKFLSLFPDLLDLDFDLWAAPWYVQGEISGQIKMAQFSDWKLACPKLTSVSYIDGSILWPHT